MKSDSHSVRHAVEDLELYNNNGMYDMWLVKARFTSKGNKNILILKQIVSGARSSMIK